MTIKAQGALDRLAPQTTATTLTPEERERILAVRLQDGAYIDRHGVTWRRTLGDGSRQGGFIVTTVPRLGAGEATFPPYVEEILAEDERRRGLGDAPTPDLVNHPPHYTVGGIETIDFIEAKGLGYHLGNVVKYIARSAHKGATLEDLKKARWYLDRAIANAERSTT